MQALYNERKLKFVCVKVHELCELCTLKKALCMRCLPLRTIGSSYSYWRCNISGRPLTRDASAVPLRDCKRPRHIITQHSSHIDHCQHPSHSSTHHRTEHFVGELESEWEIERKIDGTVCMAEDRRWMCEREREREGGREGGRERGRGGEGERGRERERARGEEEWRERR